MFWAGEHGRAAGRFRESLALAASLDDASLQALALAGLARVALYTDAAEAVRLLREALELTRDLPDDDPGRSSVVHVLGPALQMSGDLEGAREVIGQRLAAAERQGDAFVVWTESANLSMVERQLGNLDRAGELSRQAVDTETARGHDLYLGWTLNGLAAVTAAKGESVRAATVLGAAASLLERGGGEWPPTSWSSSRRPKPRSDEPCRRRSSTGLAPRGLPCPASRPSRTPCRRAAVSNVPYDPALDCAVGAAKAWLASLPTRRVAPAIDAGAMLAALSADLPEQPADAAAVIDELARAAGPGLMGVGSGSFHGWVMGGVLPPSKRSRSCSQPLDVPAARSRPRKRRPPEPRPSTQRDRYGSRVPHVRQQPVGGR